MTELHQLAQKYCPIFYERWKNSWNTMKEVLSLMESVKQTLSTSLGGRKVSTLSKKHSQVLLHCIDPMRSWGFIESAGVSFNDMLDCIVYIQPTISTSSIQFWSRPNLFWKYWIILRDGIVEKSFSNAMQTKWLPQSRKSRHKKFRWELQTPQQELELAIDLEWFEKKFLEATNPDNWHSGINNEIFVSEPEVCALFLLESELMQNPNVAESLKKEATIRWIPFYILSQGGYFHLYCTSEMAFEVWAILDSQISLPDKTKLASERDRIGSKLLFK